MCGLEGIIKIAGICFLIYGVYGCYASEIREPRSGRVRSRYKQPFQFCANVGCYIFIGLILLFRDNLVTLLAQ